MLLVTCCVLSLLIVSQKEENDTGCFNYLIGALPKTRKEGQTMTKVAAFYRDRVGEDYHDNDKCGPGSEIPKADRKTGTGNKPHCKHCAKLNSEGK